LTIPIVIGSSQSGVVSPGTKMQVHAAALPLDLVELAGARG
jgi:hypothetical protein